MILFKVIQHFRRFLKFSMFVHYYLFVAVFSDLHFRMRIVSFKYFLTQSDMTCFMLDWFCYGLY